MSARKLSSSFAALAVLCGAVAAQAQEGQGYSQVSPRADVRTTLGAGVLDAEQAASGLTLTHSIAPPPGFFDPSRNFSPPTNDEEMAALRAQAEANPATFSVLGLANSDMAMSNGRLFVGSFHGFNIYDVSGQGAPQLMMSVVCPGGQGDLSVHGDLLFMSVEEGRGRLDCGASGITGQVSSDRFRGVRIFDISNIQAPRQIAAVQTCRGSHTHTLVPDPNDPKVLYVYVSGTAGVRKSDELAICSDGEPGQNAETALYSIDVIRVPLDHPEQAAIVNRPRIFADRETGAVNGLWTGGRYGVAGQDTAPTNQCHDITVFPEINRAAGACSGNGILLDISDRANPKRISEMFDPDMSYWHSATFNNTGDKVVFTDEWGGGVGARCTSTDPASWGANLVATIEADGRMQGRSFHKLPSFQGPNENCVAHNGNLIPVPGRDLMVQAWYQGGVSIMDFTDPSRPVEIAYFDRGPLDAERLRVGGSWSAYWFNGRIYSSEIARGVDVLELIPTEHLSAAEIAAARAIQTDVINPQVQTRVSWRDTPDVATSYVDQLGRDGRVDRALVAEARGVVDGWRNGRVDRNAARAVGAQLTAAAEAENANSVDVRHLKALADLLSRIAV